MERQKITNALQDLRTTLTRLIESITQIELLQDSLSRIPALSRLIASKRIHDNPIRKILPTERVLASITYSEADYERHTTVLEEIDDLLKKSPFVEHEADLVDRLRAELDQVAEAADLEEIVRETIDIHREELDHEQVRENQELTSKRRAFQALTKGLRKYLKFHHQFYNSLEKISEFSISIPTKPIRSMGHSLSISNEFELAKEKFLDVVNEALKTPYRFQEFDDIVPELLFKERFKKRDPKIVTYQDFENYVNGRFAEMNCKTYKITTSDGRDFDQLSAGWKTSVILDLVLGWDADRAPLIIDQPEDNLATSYINAGLLAAIKETKSKKQIILVSHNATIPMLGDAQNVVLCTNENNNISIASGPLEGSIDGRSVVDLIAEVTDGGKSSIKKRVKKYNLKDYRGPK